MAPLEHAVHSRERLHCQAAHGKACTRVFLLLMASLQLKHPYAKSLNFLSKNVEAGYRWQIF